MVEIYLSGVLREAPSVHTIQEKRISALRTVVNHMVLGSLFGLLILTPMSLFINKIVETDTFRLFPFGHILSHKHIMMALYFGLLGSVMGLLKSVSIHKKVQLHEELIHLSVTDELTSLYNRRYFEDQLRRELERAQRYSHKVSLLMADLDNFKYINDTLGHRQGDLILRKVSHVLQQSVRKPDFVARYGGDEFVIVMPETDEENAQKLMQRIYSKVRALRLHNGDGLEGSVSLSMGIATFPDDSADIDGLVNRADARLYQHKDTCQRPCAGHDKKQKHDFRLRRDSIPI